MKSQTLAIRAAYDKAKEPKPSFLTLARRFGVTRNVVAGALHRTKPA